MSFKLLFSNKMFNEDACFHVLSKKDNIVQETGILLESQLIPVS